MAEPASLILAPSAARTASEYGSGYDAERAGRSVTGALDVTAASGTAPTLLVTLESSETGGEDDDWSRIAAFPSCSGITKLWLNGYSAARYVRARWEISGDAPSFTFEVKARAYSHLIDATQFTAHLSEPLVRLAFDDHATGAPDFEAIDSVLAYASSMLRGKIGPADDLSGFTPEQQSEVIRIGLDICHARAAMRAPEVFRIDGYKLLECARKDLREIRLGAATAGLPARPPAEASEGVVVSGTNVNEWC